MNGPEDGWLLQISTPAAMTAPAGRLPPGYRADPARAARATPSTDPGALTQPILRAADRLSTGLPSPPESVACPALARAQ